MPIYNLLEYSENYATTSASLWQYFRDEPDDNMKDFESFKFKSSINTNNAGIADENIVVP